MKTRTAGAWLVALATCHLCEVVISGVMLYAGLVWLEVVSAEIFSWQTFFGCIFVVAGVRK
jgi:hypothetical protein